MDLGSRTQGIRRITQIAATHRRLGRTGQIGPLPPFLVGQGAKEMRHCSRWPVEIRWRVETWARTDRAFALCGALSPGSAKAQNGDAPPFAEWAARAELPKLAKPQLRGSAGGVSACESGPKGRSPPLGHELIELGAVLGEAQPLEEFLELALLVFEPLQRLCAIVVEGVIAARSRAEPVAAAPDAIHPGAHTSIFSCMRAILRSQRSLPRSQSSIGPSPA